MEENAALGVAILAGLATGVFNSLEYAVKSMVSIALDRSIFCKFSINITLYLLF